MGLFLPLCTLCRRIPRRKAGHSYPPEGREARLASAGREQGGKVAWVLCEGDNEGEGMRVFSLMV